MGRPVPRTAPLLDAKKIIIKALISLLLQTGAIIYSIMASLIHELSIKNLVDSN